MTGERSKPRVVFVMSTNYAGSTVLGLVLASHSKAAFVGEPATLLRRSRSGDFKHKRFCTTCQDDGSICPVWSTSLVSEVRSHPDHVYALASGALRQTLGDHDFLVDASKNLGWMDAGHGRASEIACVHITKSVESFTASVLTRNAGKGRCDFIAADWAERNTGIRDYCVRKSVPYLHVRYRDFASDLPTTLRRLATFLGIEPEPQQEKFWEHQHHYVKGNPGTASHFEIARVEREPGMNRDLYKENHRRIFLDEKWRELLLPGAVDEIYALPRVIRVSEAFGYAHPLRAEGSPPLMKMRAQTLGRGIEAARTLARRARDLASR